VSFLSASYTFRPSTLKESEDLLSQYLQGLSLPMESYAEDNLIQCKVFSIDAGDTPIGFFALQDETLWFFHVMKERVRYAQDIFAEVIETQGIKEIYVQTSDALLVSLTMDWEFEKRKSAYFFVDGRDTPRPELNFPDVTFTPASLEDFDFIQQETNGFFSPDDLKNGTIFMLRSSQALLGCGIGVPGRFFTDCMSIGMVTCAGYRRRGVGKYILWKLKKWCYEQGLKPIAGCWYYNTLSRRSLESAGMVSLARGITAVLTGKEAIPERTGNPPGEPVQ
jgi:GNAT superfamily N-acetyltransferase